MIAGYAGVISTGEPIGSVRPERRLLNLLTFEAQPGHNSDNCRHTRGTPYYKEDE